MHLKLASQNTFEKVIRDTNGFFVRATFVVYTDGLRVKARLIHAERIDQDESKNDSTFLLKSSESQNQSPNFSYLLKPIASPFFWLNILIKNGSKPRAPTVLS